MAGKEPPTDQRVVVLAGNYREFLHWCQEHDMNPHDRRRVVFASGYPAIRGLGPFRLETYGTWVFRYDAVEILTYLRDLEKRYATREE